MGAGSGSFIEAVRSAVSMRSITRSARPLAGAVAPAETEMGPSPAPFSSALRSSWSASTRSVFSKP